MIQTVIITVDVPDRSDPLKIKLRYGQTVNDLLYELDKNHGIKNVQICNVYGTSFLRSMPFRGNVQVQVKNEC